jgi:rhamnogalacturonan endolyase
MVLGSGDYLNDGPTKQDLTSAQGYILQHLNMNHYGAGGVEVNPGESWRKIYGPWLLYVTNEPTVEANWNAAKKRADAEKAAWPYQWMTDPDYAAQTRGSASGRLVVHDPLKPKVSAAGAWVGLAQSEKKTGKNWQFQADAYQYWTQAKPDGSFSIPAVRPGTYTLYAFTTGAVGEYSQEDVTVSAKQDTALGTVTWNVPHMGSKIAWEIGIPDRTAAEFRHSKDYWLPYLFTRFSSEFSNPLVYDTAKGNWSTAINYAQSNYNKQPWPWQLNFDLHEPPKSDATLTIAFAGSNQAKLDIHVNDHKLESIYPPNQGGNALLREGVHAKYGLSYVTIPAKDLKAGRNAITLTQAKVEGDASHVMYDYINLELP